MWLKINLLILTTAVFFLQIGISKQVNTISAGCWDDGKIWDTQITPTYSDSIFINHPVFNDRGIYLRNNGYIHISSTGYLCIQGDIEIPCGCFFINYGFIYCNNFNLTGDGNNYGQVQAQTNYHVQSCNVPYSHGLVQVGGTQDTCVKQLCNKTINEEVTLYPIPIVNNFNIDFLIKNKQRVKIDLFNSLGEHIQHLFDEQMTPDYYKLSFFINLNESIYAFLKININNQIIVKRLVYLSSK